jgi:(p)ppGpp synthase/HD superfamily hydrolase
MTLNEFNIHRKSRLPSKSKSDESDKKLFLSFINTSRSESSVNILEDFSKYIETLEYDHGDLSKAQYLAHPFRVALLLLQTFPDIEDDYIKLALCHNVIEVSYLSPNLIETLGVDMISYVKTLTVDRSCQWNWEYKKNYYHDISKNKITKVIKIFDKLDNLFLLSGSKVKEIKMNYLSEITNYVIPLVVLETPSLIDDFKTLVKINYELLDQ